MFTGSVVFFQSAILYKQLIIIRNDYNIVVGIRLIVLIIIINLGTFMISLRGHDDLHADPCAYTIIYGIYICVFMIIYQRDILLIGIYHK